jgi:hypothetical protein
MLSKITSAVSTRGLNIENMLNAGAKGRDVAYTIIDLHKAADDELANELRRIGDVIRVRILA